MGQLGEKGFEKLDYIDLYLFIIINFQTFSFKEGYSSWKRCLS